MTKFTAYELGYDDGSKCNSNACLYTPASIPTAFAADYQRGVTHAIEDNS